MIIFIFRVRQDDHSQAAPGCALVVCVLLCMLLCCDECLHGGLVDDVLWRREAAVAYIQCALLVVCDEEPGLAVQRDDGVAVSEDALDVAMLCLVEVVEDSVSLEHADEVTVGGVSSLHELGHDAELRCVEASCHVV